MDDDLPASRPQGDVASPPPRDVASSRPDDIDPPRKGFIFRRPKDRSALWILFPILIGIVATVLTGFVGWAILNSVGIELVKPEIVKDAPHLRGEDDILRNIAELEVWERWGGMVFSLGALAWGIGCIIGGLIPYRMMRNEDGSFGKACLIIGVVFSILGFLLGFTMPF